jgi:hypothetical protein
MARLGSLLLALLGCVASQGPEAPPQIRFFHASPDAPAVDVLGDDADGVWHHIFTNVAFGAATAFIPAVWPPVWTTLRITPTDKPETVLFQTSADTGAFFPNLQTTITAVGMLSDKSFHCVYPQSPYPYCKKGYGVCCGRFFHASPDAPGVDFVAGKLLSNKVTLVSDLSFPHYAPDLGHTTSKFLGKDRLSIRLHNATKNLLSIEYNCKDGGASTIAIIGRATGTPELQLKVLDDKL